MYNYAFLRPAYAFLNPIRSEINHFGWQYI